MLGYKMRKQKDHPEQVNPLQILLPDVFETIQDPDLRLFTNRVAGAVGVTLLAGGVLLPSEFMVVLGSIELSGAMLSENNTRKELGLPYIRIEK